MTLPTRYQARMRPMPEPIPLARDLVLIGGGHTHALVLRMWGMDPVPGVRLTVINPGPSVAYSGMLPGFVAGHYGRAALDIDLVRLCRHAGARLIAGRATAIDRAARRITAGDRPIRYDIASVDIGISSDMPALPGFAGHAVPAKPLDAFADRWAAFCADPPRNPRVTVIGAGVVGGELALAAAHRLGPDARVTLIDAGAPLALLGSGARSAMLAHLARARIGLIARTAVTHVIADGVHLADGRILPSDFTIGAAAATPGGWLAGTGLTLRDGFIAVGPTLRSSDPAIFAAGDIAHMTGSPRPKAGVFAVRQAPVLLRNLTVALTGQGGMRPYRPQRDYLKLVSTGHRNAVADKWGLRLDAPLLWRWKDRIDRRFTDRLNHLPAMPRAPLPGRIAAGAAEALGTGPLCGGCGAKVAPATLAAALAALPPPARADILSRPGDDAATLLVGDRMQVLTTDHLRSVTADPSRMARIAAVHALGDIWAMGAVPQAALSQIILPRASDAIQADMLDEILAAAARVFAAEGAAIVGGHTSIGDELTIGFALTGLLDRPAIGHSGARPGDALILTKPIGAGTILAAEMTGAARGADVIACLDAMELGSGAAAAILAPVARAMTDVTGFGLAGHLMNILGASGVSARLDLAALPLLPGALALAAAGHASTLAPANRAALAGRIDAPDTARAALLHDPQTAGGLLAAVPADRADALIAALRDVAPASAVIGRLRDGPPRIVAGA